MVCTRGRESLNMGVTSLYERLIIYNSRSKRNERVYSLEGFAQLVLHNLYTPPNQHTHTPLSENNRSPTYLRHAFSDGSDCHEPGMPQPPVVVSDHTGNVLERRREYSLATQSAREPIDRLPVHMRVRVIRRVLRRPQSKSASNEYVIITKE